MKRFLQIVSVCLLITPLLLSCCGNKETEKLSVNYTQYTLENGLKVVLHQDKSDPIVCVAIQYHVGSGREKAGKTGFAHFFEHMLFQRSENLPRNAFFQKISAMGGNFNGGTGQDGTVYYDVVPRDALEKVLWMESDRMGFFINTVTQAGLDREIDVILNEKRQTADNVAYGQLEAILGEELFPKGHPYSWSVIGDMDDIRSATIEDVKEFYTTYYIPRNATLCIAGDFDEAQAKALVEKYFGEIATGNEIAKPTVQNVTLAQTKKVMYEDPFAPLPMMVLAYPAPEQYSKDEAALDVFGELFGGSKKSPLYKAIVDANLAPFAGAYNMAQECAGAFLIQSQAYDGVSIDTLYAAVEKAMAQFEATPIDATELQKIKAMKERNTYNQLASVNGKAIQLARNTEYGGKPDRFIDELEAFKAVTAADVMRVYNQYIKGKTYLAISLVPAGKAALAMSGSVPAKVKVENVEDASSQQTKSKAGAIVDDDYPRTPSAFDRSIEPAYLSNAPEVTLPAMWTKELSNGMKVTGITQNEIPLVTFDVTIKGGQLLDPADKPGLASLTTSLMNEGTEQRTAQEIEQALNLLGASARVYSSVNTVGISGNCLSRNFGQVMEIVEEMLLHPRFDAEELARQKNKVIASIQSDEKDPNTIARQTASKLLYGANSVLAIPHDGTRESVDAITMDDIKAFYKLNFTPALASISLAGAIDLAGSEAALQQLVADWSGEKVDVPTPVIEQTGNMGKTFFVDYPGAKQSVIVVGGFGKSYADPDYYALNVLNFKLGSGSNGQLFDVLRLQRGYTYGAYSGFSPRKEYGSFSASSSVQSTVTKESVGIFHDLLGNYGERFTQEMLDATKDALLRSKAFAFETQYSLIGMLKNIYLYDLPKDYVKQEEVIIKDATVDQIKALAKQYLNDDNLIYVVVGDAKSQLKNVAGATLVK